MKTLKQILLEAEASQAPAPQQKKPAQTPQRRATDVPQSNVYDRLDQSNPSNPVMFTTRQGPATVYKDLNGWYIVKIGKTTFPNSPSQVLKSQDELDNWFRSSGAMSMGQ